jgi:hypothetical protein
MWIFGMTTDLSGQAACGFIVHSYRVRDRGDSPQRAFAKLRLKQGEARTISRKPDPVLRQAQDDRLS